MELFREKLKIQNLSISICCFILAAFSFLSAAGEAGIIHFMTPAAGDSHWQSMWRGFIVGASAGILILLIVGLIRNIQALCDEKKLKELYVKEHDERQIQIWTSARALSMQIFVLGGLVAGIIAGYFNMTVSITILACVFIHSLLGGACKIYYSRKF